MSCSVTSPPRSTSSSTAPSKSLTGPKSSSMRRLKGELGHKQGHGFVTSPKNIYPLGQTLAVIRIGNVLSWTWIESFAFYLSGNIFSMLSSPAAYTPIVHLFLRASHVPWSFVSLLHGGTTPQSLLTRRPATPSPPSHLFLLRTCQGELSQLCPLQIRQSQSCITWSVFCHT